MDFDCFKNHTPDASFSFESAANSNEFQDLQHLFDDSQDQVFGNGSYEFPSLDDICLHAEINNNRELLPFGDITLESSNGVGAKNFQQNMNLSVYDDDQHKMNQYVMEFAPNLTRNSYSSSSSMSAMLVHEIQPIS